MKQNTICVALLSATLLIGASLTGLSQEAGVVSADLQHHAIPRVLLEPSVDDTLVQAELSKVGGVMVEVRREEPPKPRPRNSLFNFA